MTFSKKTEEHVATPTIKQAETPVQQEEQKPRATVNDLSIYEVCVGGRLFVVSKMRGQSYGSLQQVYENGTAVGCWEKP